MPYSASRMLASKTAYSAGNSAGRIYPSLETCHRRQYSLNTNKLSGKIIRAFGSHPSPIVNDVTF